MKNKYFKSAAAIDKVVLKPGLYYDPISGINKLPEEFNSYLSAGKCSILSFLLLSCKKFLLIVRQFPPIAFRIPDWTNNEFPVFKRRMLWASVKTTTQIKTPDTYL
jgi:hypothetical protein